jgi:release factor glutamine methyltransferase
LKELNPDEVLRRVVEATSPIPSSVYSPREDSYLLLDAVKTIRVESRTVLDLGTGSGILGLYCALQGANVTIADIDSQAVQHVTEAAKRLGVELHAVTSDLFSNIPGRFNVILFNPPYLPSERLEDHTVDGGPEGRVMINRFLNELAGHLKKDGVAYLLVSSLNSPASVVEAYPEYEFVSVARKSLFFEELQVLCARLRNDLSSQ